MRAALNNSRGLEGILRACAAAGVLVLAATLAGCSKKTDEVAPVVDDRQAIQAQIATDDSLAAKLEAGSEETIRQIEQMEATDKQLHEMFAAVLARPGEVRTEIVADVDRRGQETAQEQADGEKALLASLDENDAAMARTLRERFGEMRATLDASDRLMDFFFASQDSLNRVLLSRGGEASWYKIIVSPGGNPSSNPTPKP